MSSLGSEALLPAILLPLAVAIWTLLLGRRPSVTARRVALGVVLLPVLALSAAGLASSRPLLSQLGDPISLLWWFGSARGSMSSLPFGADGISLMVCLVVALVGAHRIAGSSSPNAADHGGRLFTVTLLTVAALALDLRVVAAALLATELGTALEVERREPRLGAVLRAIGAGMILLSGARFAELHDRALGRFAFDYDALVAMTLPPPVQRPLYLLLFLGALLWGIGAAWSTHSRTHRSIAGAPDGTHPILDDLWPLFTTYLLLRFAIPLFPHAASAAQPRAILLVTTLLALSGFLAGLFVMLGRGVPTNGRAWTSLYAGTAVLLLLGLEPSSWVGAATLAGLCAALPHVEAWLTRLPALARVGLFAGPPLLLLASFGGPSFEKLPTPAALGVTSALFMAFALTAFAVVRREHGSARARRSTALPEAARPAARVLACLLLALPLASVLPIRSTCEPILAYTRERIAHPTPPGQVRFEHVGRSTAPTRALGIVRATEGAP